MSASDVISGASRWAVEQADCLPWLQALPADCVDLVVTSPPYAAARSYAELDFKLTGEAWVKWMFGIVRELSRVCRGLIAIVCDDQTVDYRWGCTPFLLAADLHRAGYCLRHPCCYFRFGVPGSGGTDWLRNDHEPILCITRGGKLPFADNTACGHLPKWGPGGEMSNRLKNGERVCQWGTHGANHSLGRKRDGEKAPPRPSMRQTVINGTPQPGLFGDVEEPEVDPLMPHGVPSNRRASGKRRNNKPGLFGDVEEPVVNPLTGRPEGQHFCMRPDGYHPPAEPESCKGEPGLFGEVEEAAVDFDQEGNRRRRRTSSHGTKDGFLMENAPHKPYAIANPGNVLKATYDAEAVRQLLESFVSREIDQGDLIRCLVGGGAMGHPLAHENEAPFSLDLPMFFIKSFCPPGGICLDPFLGSGSTIHAALEAGRRGIGCDLRPSQIEIARRRLAGITPAFEVQP